MGTNETRGNDVKRENSTFYRHGRLIKLLQALLEQVDLAQNGRLTLMDTLDSCGQVNVTLCDELSR